MNIFFFPEIPFDLVNNSQLLLRNVILKFGQKKLVIKKITPNPT